MQQYAFFSIVLAFMSGLQHFVLMDKPQELYFLFFKLKNDTQAEYAVKEAVNIAVDIINNRTDVLPIYKLICDTVTVEQPHLANAMKILIEELWKKPTKIMMLGPSSQVIGKGVSEIAPLYNLIHISYSLDNPEFSNRNKYSLFFRTIQTKTVYNSAVVAILEHFNWTKVFVFYEAEEFEEEYKLFEQLSKSKNITILDSRSIVIDSAFDLNVIKIAKAKIIIAFFSNNDFGRKLMCQVHKQVLYGARFQWLLLADGGPPNWFQDDNASLSITNCSSQDLVYTLEGSFHIESVLEQKDVQSDLGIGTQTLKNKIKNNLRERNSNPVFYQASNMKTALLAFDAVWTMALALNNSIENLWKNKSLENFTYTDNDIANVISDEIYKLKFQGVTGLVSFDKSGSRVGKLLVHQVQNSTAVLLGPFDAIHDCIDWDVNITFKFPGGLSPPKDSPETFQLRLTTNPNLFFALCGICGLGLTYSTLCFCFNIYYMEHRFVKMSSPRMNNLIILGCILCYMSVIIIGSDCVTKEENFTNTNCKFNAWILSLGFTFAFGSMFSKTWRVYLIFTNKKLEKKIIKDWHLYIMVAVLFLIDVILFLCWEIMDPLVVYTQTFLAEIDPLNEDIFYVRRTLICTSKNYMYWTSGLFTFKGLLLLYGIFLVWETRNIKVPALNDSKQIGMCIYNVMVMSVIAVVVVHLQEPRQVDLSYVISSVCILAATTITLSLVFMPKMYTVFNGGEMVTTATVKPAGSVLNNTLDSGQSNSVMNKQH